MRLEPVLMSKSKSIEEILTFYMGKNTPERQTFIIDNLKFEEDYFEEEIEKT
jgi:topoisomerase-4 subunit B